MAVKILLVTLVLFILAVSSLVFIHSRSYKDNLLSNGDIKTTSNSADTLVVMLHAFSNKGNSLNAAEIHVREFYNKLGRQVDIFKPDLPLDSLSIASNSKIVAELLKAIDLAWQKNWMAANPTNTLCL